MVEQAGADIVDINFGCPVRKVTKTGAGATLLDDPELACRIVDAVASAVDVPVTVKMRRGLEDGSRACLEVGPRLVDAGAQSLTLHPRSARQMYTGTADHSLTAELVERVDVPVVASGDITSRARAQAVLATTGASAVMVGRAAQGNPWALREMLDGEAAEPTREEVAAELILFVRETVRELGEHRAVRLPEEVLRLVSRPRPLPEAVQAGARPARLDGGGRHASARGSSRAQPRSSSASRPRRRRATRSRSSSRSRSTAAASSPRGCSPGVRYVRPGVDPRRRCAPLPHRNSHRARDRRARRPYRSGLCLRSAPAQRACLGALARS